MMAVLDPVKLIIDNYPEDQMEEIEIDNNLENESLGKRKIPFGRELYIDREDFMENPPKKYFRLFPGNEVRLMGAYFVKCVDYKKDENGNVRKITLLGYEAQKAEAELHRKKSKRNHPLGSCQDRHSGRSASL